MHELVDVAPSIEEEVRPRERQQAVFRVVGDEADLDPLRRLILDKCVERSGGAPRRGG